MRTRLDRNVICQIQLSTYMKGAVTHCQKVVSKREIASSAMLERYQRSQNILNAK